MGGQLTKSQQKLFEHVVKISQTETTSYERTYLHSIICQVGLPRRKVDGLEFERTCGNAGLYIRAGKLWDGEQFIQQPVPYGPMPRLILSYLNSEALKNNSPIIEVGKSATDFLKKLGKSPSGGNTGSYTSFRKQVLALSACNLTLGFNVNGKANTYDGKPIQQFEAWVNSSSQKSTLWPNAIEFSQDYYQTLKMHAVPLRFEALRALAGSALAMDIYVMLAERLHRINKPSVMLYWKNLRDQFGQEYIGPNASKNFKKSFIPAFRKAVLVYPAADVVLVKGGVLMRPSPPAVPKLNK